MKAMEKTFDLEGFDAAVGRLCGFLDVKCDLTSHSILGHEIPVFTLGQGQKSVVYVGGVRGTESVLSRILLDFIGDYLERLKKGGTVFDINLSYLWRERRVIVVPMLNPDGVSYATKGIDLKNPLAERVLKMNNGSEDLKDWQANARGTDLSYNFDAGFGVHKAKAGLLNGAPKGYGGEYPESEPESAALCRFLRFLGEDLLGLVEFRLGSGEIKCSCRDKISAKTMAAGRILGRATGYRLIGPEKAEPEGGVADWCIEKLSRPAYRVDCDLGKYREDKACACLFESLRRTFYTFPFMV